MLKEHVDLLSSLNAHGVKYLIVGGHAVSVHSEPRATKDLDVFIRTDEENTQRVFHALARYGAPLAGMTPADFRDNTVYQFGVSPYRIDVLQEIEAVAFDSAWERRASYDVVPEEGGESVPAWFISVDDLITNKLAVGRHRDLADVEAIQDAAAALVAKPKSKQK